jgi:hypothetical protein
MAHEDHRSAVAKLRAVEQYFIDTGGKEPLRILHNQWTTLSRQVGGVMGGFPVENNSCDEAVEEGARRLLEQLGTQPIFAEALKRL